MKSSLENDYRNDPAKACRKALKMTRALKGEARLQACNDLLGCFGIEAIRGEWQNGYWRDIVASYCNTGDTYATTVMLVRGSWSGASARFIVSSWGDFVETHEQLCSERQS